MYKRILSLLLCFALICSFAPVLPQAHAQEQGAVSSNGTAAPEAGQLGAWIYASTIYERGAGSAEALMQQYAEVGITDVYLQVKGIDGKLAWASSVSGGTRLYADRDILAEVCAAAELYGIRVHASIMASRDEAYIVNYPESPYYHFCYGYTSSVNRYINLRDEGYRSYMAALVKELTANYSIAGIHLDHVRYGSISYDWGKNARDLLLTQYGITIEQYNAATLAMCAEISIHCTTATGTTSGYNGGASYTHYVYRENGTVPSVTPISTVLTRANPTSDAYIGAKAFYEMRTDTVAQFIDYLSSVAGNDVCISTTLMPDALDGDYFAAIYGQDAEKISDVVDYVALCSFTGEFSFDAAWLADTVSDCVNRGCNVLVGIQASDTATGQIVFDDVSAAYGSTDILGICLSRGDTALLAGADFFPENNELRLKLSNQSAQDVSKVVIRLQNGMKVTSVGESANWRDTYSVSVSADGTTVTVSANGANILNVGEIGYLDLNTSGTPSENASYALVQAYSGASFAEIPAFCGAVLHTYTTESTTPPTCDMNGSVSYTCSHCDITLTEFIDTLPHNYTYTDNRDATHTATCPDCGDSMLAAHEYKNGVCACGAKQEENNMLYFSFNQSEADALRYNSAIYGYTDFNDTYNWRLSNWSNTGVSNGTVTGTIGKDGSYLRTSISGTTDFVDCPLQYVPGKNDVFQICFKLENTTATNAGVKLYYYETGAPTWETTIGGAGKPVVMGEYMVATIPLANTVYADVTQISGIQVAFYNVPDGEISVDYIYIGPESHLPTAHDFDIVVTAPTCTAQGYSTYTCKNCGMSYKTDYVPAAHTVVTDAAVEATCTETGLTEGSHCEACGEVFVAQEVIPAKGHSYDAETHICSGCGNLEIITVKISCNGELVEGWVFSHEYGTEAPLPAVTAPEGYYFEGYAESENGEIVWRTERLYIFTKNVTLYAVFSPIYTVTWNVDGKITEESYISGQTPSFKGSTAKAADGCTAYDFEGWDKEITVVSGDVTYTAVYTARDVHRDVVTDKAVVPTCTKTGLTEGSHCAACGTVLVAQEEVPTAAHSFDAETHICTVCGTTEQVTVRFNWNSELIDVWVITKDYGTRATLPTLSAPKGYRFVGYAESENGEIVWRNGEYYTYTKNVTLYAVFVAIYTVAWDVDGVLTEEIYEDGQTPVFKGSTDKAANGCTLYDFAGWDKEITAVSGNITYTATYTERIVHLNIVTDEAKQPSCTETGLTEGAHCEACGEVTVAQEVIPVTGHDTVATAAKEASCTENGNIAYWTCKTCKKIYTDAECKKESTLAMTIVPALGHTVVIDEAVDASCTESGLTQGKHCSVCGETLIAQKPVAPLGHDWTETDENGSRYCTCCGLIYAPIVNIADGTIILDEENGEKFFTVNGETHPYSGSFVLTGQTDTYTVCVCRGEHDVVLSNLSITSAEDSPFSILPSASVNLTLDGENSLRANDTSAAIHVPRKASLTIDGEGSLEAYSSCADAVIGAGGGEDDTCGTIIVNGGTLLVSAEGETIGIGGAECDIAFNGGYTDLSNVLRDMAIGGDDGHFIAYGGTINAHGDRFAAEWVAVYGGSIHAEIEGNDLRTGARVHLTPSYVFFHEELDEPFKLERLIGAEHYGINDIVLINDVLFPFVEVQYGIINGRCFDFKQGKWHDHSAAGTDNNDDSTHTCPCGAAALHTPNDEGICTACGAAYVAQVGTTFYRRLDAALEAVPENGALTTITIFCDTSIIADRWQEVKQNEHILITSENKDIQIQYMDPGGDTPFEEPSLTINGTLIVEDTLITRDHYGGTIVNNGILELRDGASVENLKNNGTLRLSGAPRISSFRGGTLEIVGDLTGEPITIYMDEPGVFGKLVNVSAENAKKLIPGLEGYGVRVNEDNTLELVLHEHAWEYVTSGETMQRVCANEDSFCTEPQTGCITIRAPYSLVYDSWTKEVLIEGEIPNVTVSSITYNGSWLTPVNAGTYDVVVSFTDGSQTMTLSTQFTIEPAHVYVDGGGAESKTYDGTTEVELSYIYLSGIIGTDVLMVDTSEVTANVLSANAGQYTSVILSGELKLDGYSAANYVLETPQDNIVSANVTIYPRPLTITAEDQSILDGEQIDSSKYTYSELSAGDTLASVVLTPSTTQPTIAGTITPCDAVILQGTDDVTKNYSITYVEGKLVISCIEHIFENYQDNGDGTHTVSCVCGESRVEPHKYVNDVCDCKNVLVEATVTDADGNVTEYSNFIKALEAAEPGALVTVMRELVLDERIVIDADDDITIDLNGFKVTTLAIDTNYDVMIKGKLTICDSKENGEMVLSGNYGIGVSTVAGASLTVEGGTFAHAGDYMIGSWGSTSITGGTFNASYCAVNAFAGTANVSGGNFEARADDSEVILGNTTLTGGTYDRDVSEYCAVGYVVSQNGRYTVVACTHENCEYTYENANEYWHSVTCSCGIVLPNESHSYKDGVCTFCGRGLIENCDIYFCERDGMQFYYYKDGPLNQYSAPFYLSGTTTEYRVIV